MSSNFPTIFSFDGENVRFEPITKFNWTAKIKIREYKSELILQGIQSNGYTCSPQIGKQSLPLCKSNLQKCVRRKDSDRAIRTALAMYSYNPNEILRRIPVIMIEDSLIHPPSLVKIVWWMCAVSKGYKMSVKEVEDMLGILATMCESNEFDVAKSLDEKPTKNIEFSALKEDQKTFIRCLELRSIYGGMHSDKRMCYYHMDLWYKRFIEKSSDKFYEQDEYDIDISSVDKITKDDLLIEAFDYHPYPWMGRKIAEKFQNLEQLLTEEKRENINKAIRSGDPHSKGLWLTEEFPKVITEKNVTSSIWDCRSRLNFRIPVNTELYRKTSPNTQRMFNIIEHELNRLCVWLKDEIDLSE